MTSIEDMDSDTLETLKKNMYPEAFPLQNTGVLCYFNSLLQALTSCTSFNDVILKYEGTEKEQKNIVLMVYIRFLKAVMAKENTTGYSKFLSRALCQKLTENSKGSQGKNTTFGSQQESASECFVLLLDILNIGKLRRLFSHRYELKIYCGKCKEHVSEELDICTQLDYFQNVEVDSPEKFSRFLCRNVGKLEGYVCPKCGEMSDGLREHRLRMLPEIIFIVMNKYKKKSEKYIPNEFSVPKMGGGTLDYTLVAHIDHSGCLSGGHYTATVIRKDGIYLCNDMSLQRRDEFNNNPNTYIAIFHAY
jgi:ubiquitin C-terminal hydrolase